jgi:hypothetical protein
MLDLINPIIAIVSYGVGFLSGYIAHAFIDKSDENRSSALVLIIVTLIWAFSMIVDIISPAYETSPLLHGLMGAIVGFYYKTDTKKV